MHLSSLMSCWLLLFISTRFSALPFLPVRESFYLDASCLPLGFDILVDPPPIPYQMSLKIISKTINI